MTRDPRDRSAKPNRMGGKPARGGKPGPDGQEPPIIHGAVPPRDVLMRFIAENPDRASKREISKAFGLKGDTRVELKALLRELEQDGLLQKSRKSLVRPGALPPVTVLDITTVTAMAN